MKPEELKHSKVYVSYLIEYETMTSAGVNKSRFNNFEDALGWLRYLYKRNEDYVKFFNISFKKIEKTHYDIEEITSIDKQENKEQWQK